MRAADIAKYLTYAAPDTDLVVLTRDTYERLMRKAKALDTIKIDIQQIYKITERS